MNFGKWQANSLLIVCVLSLCLLGCATSVVPKPVTGSTISYDGNERNSGIKQYIEGQGFLVTPHFRVRYNNLIEKYGKKFENPIKKDDGLVNFGADYLINKQHMIYF
jgi:hypothetical protein